MSTTHQIATERSASSSREQVSETYKNHKGSWKRKPAWPKLRLVTGQTIDLLILGDLWSFRLHASGRDHLPSKRHLANIIDRKALTNPQERHCLVWEMNDRVFNSIDAIAGDQAKNWIRVTRYGAGKKDTRYKIEALRSATDSEMTLVSSKLFNNLELAAIETCSRHKQKHAKWIA